MGMHTVNDTSRGAPDNFVVLSRDNQKLAYTTWDEGFARRYLKINDYQTEETTDNFRDVPDRTEIIKISWMPNSKTLLYIRNNTALFGYKKDEDDHNHLVIDEVTAPVVELIFSIAEEGVGLHTICNRLCQAKVMKSSFYKQELVERFIDEEKMYD